MDRKADMLKHLDESLVVVGVQPPEGERFCVIYQTLRTPPRLSVTHRIAAGP